MLLLWSIERGHAIRRLSLAVPLGEELGQKLLHESMPFGGQLPADRRIHAILQEEELFIEMVQGRPGIFLISTKRIVRRGRNSRIVHGPPFVSAVSKRPADADRADRIEPIGILHGLALDRP